MPELGRPFMILPKYCMMSLLFLSFLPIEIPQLLKTVQNQRLAIAALGMVKLLALPIVVYTLFHYTAPDFALSALLLSGVSTGVVSPFFAHMLESEGEIVLASVVVTSLLVPFTLPFLVKILAGKELAISLPAMVRLLVLVVLVPILLVQGLRRFAPGSLEIIGRHQFPLSLVLFTLTNLGVFSQYSDFFLRQPETVLKALVVSVTLAALFMSTGLLLSRGQPVSRQISVVLIFAIMNNILVIVFSSEFFGPIEPMVAATYSIPFFGLLFPLRLWRERGK